MRIWDWGIWRRSETFLGRPGARRSSYEGFFEELGGGGFEFGDFFGWALCDELTAVFTGFRAEVENPVGGFDDFEVVLDDEQGVAGIDEFLKDF